MKLLIGGKSRNIYMRKDGSAYYKSVGQQVDVTYMFKKNGGGLKKQYIKGGFGPDNPDSPDSFNPTEVYRQVAPQTKTKAPSKEAPAPAGAATEGAQSKGAPAGAAPKAATAPARATVPKGAAAAVAPSAAQSAALQKLADEVPLPESVEVDAAKLVDAGPPPATAAASVDAVPLLAKEAATAAAKTASALADTPPAKAKAGSGTDLEVLTDITALDDFPVDDNLGIFWYSYFDLGQLVISVTNNLCRKHNATIEIKTPNSATAEKLVKKLNGIINFILKSRISSDYKEGEGMLSPNFKSKKDYSEYQTEYLELFEDANTNFSIKKTNSLGLNHLATIFDIIGYVASLYKDDHTEDIEQFKIRICNNIHIFLNNESKLKQIKANRLLNT